MNPFALAASTHPSPASLNLIKLASSIRDGRSGTLLLFDLLALIALAQCIDINQILCSTRRNLCNQQVLTRDEWYGQIIIYSNICSSYPPTIRYLNQAGVESG